MRVFSDGTAECHTEKYWREPDTARTKQLPPEEVTDLKAILSQPELQKVEARYELMYWVVDSWMEWKIKVSSNGAVKRIDVAGFSPGAAIEHGKPYPEALAKLGCTIWRLRSEVFGDTEASSGAASEQCKAALGAN